LQHTNRLQELKQQEEELKPTFTELWNNHVSYLGIAENLGITKNRAIVLRQKYDLEPRMTTRYRLEGQKILDPITDEKFSEGMTKGHFVKQSHAAYCVLLYYSAVRKKEAFKPRENFKITETDILFDVGKREKGSAKTDPLPLPLAAPFMDTLKTQIEKTKPKEQVFDFCPKTAYNIVRRVFHYPHLFRLSRISNFLAQGYTIIEIHSWTGLSVSAINYYVGLISTRRMGESLAKKSDNGKT
jgi:hypothetical protein